MKNATHITFLVAILVFLTGETLLAAPQERQRGTIRGAIYTDVDGDGRCAGTGVSGEVAVANVNVAFVSDSGARVLLHTGANGTYGLAAAGQGTWQVMAMPDPALWVVTSPNPLSVAVSNDNGLVQLNNDFCLRAAGGTLSPARLQLLALENIESTAGTATTPTFTASRDPAENAAVSEALLSDPPELAPAPNIDEAAGTSVDLFPEAEWLAYLNLFREIGGLPTLQAINSLSEGTQFHSRYMVLNQDPIAHYEDPVNPLFTEPGDQAAIHGNLFASTQLEATFTWGINFWISAPFHLTPILDPSLQAVGFGIYNGEVGTFQMAAVLDVRSELGAAGSNVGYPLFFPGNGSATWVVRHSMYEWPDPLAGCPGFARPSGAPLVLQLGDGSLTPRVTSHRLMDGNQVLESCRFDETTYTNSNAFAQGTGREILNQRDAVVIIPRHELAMGRTFTVEVVANGQTYTWSFSTRRPPGSE